jgi:hypothetical protein
VGIILLLMVFVAAGMLLAGNESGGGQVVGFEDHGDPTVYNDRASGSRALYELASRLGYDVGISRTDWQNLPSNASLLIASAPNTGSGGDSVGDSSDSGPQAGVLDGDDAAGVLKWLRPGRTLFLMVDDLPASKKLRGAASSLPGGDFGDRFGITVGSALSARPRTDFSPVQPVGVVRGVSYIHVHEQRRVLRFAGDGVVLFGSPPTHSRSGPVGGEPVLMMFTVGKGRVYVVADGYFCSNGNLVRASNAAFAANILSESLRPGQKVLFDEYHHGDVANTHNVWTALGLPAQRGILQLGFAALVMLLVLAPRFGTPRPMADQTSRSTGEYVASLASLYRAAHAASPALDFIYRQFLRDMCSRLALPSDISLADLADAAGRRGQIDAAELKRLLGRCEQCLATTSVSENDLLDLVRRMERFRKELGID